MEAYGPRGGGGSRPAGGGMFGMKSRGSPLAVLLIVVMVGSTLLVVGWEACPLNVFSADLRQPSADVDLPGGPAAEKDAQIRAEWSADRSRPENRVTIERPKRTARPDPLFVQREDTSAFRASEVTPGVGDGESASDETARTESETTAEEIKRMEVETPQDETNWKANEKPSNDEISLKEKLGDDSEADKFSHEEKIRETGSDETDRTEEEEGATASHDIAEKVEESSETTPPEEILREDDSGDAQCDYSVGEWVPDNSRPLYSGEECKLWLAPSFSCRLNKRPDMSYENFRWQPAGCDLPKFDGSLFLNMMRNKVVAFVGDSLGRQQLQSLMCMITRGKNDTLIYEVGAEFGFFTPPGERKPTGFAYRFAATNTTIVFVWTTTLARVEALDKSDPLSRNALHLDRPAQFLSDRIHQLDVVVLNSGHHWNRGKMKESRLDFFYRGARVDEKDPLFLISNAYNLTIHAVVRWANAQIAGTRKRIFYRTLSPRHFRNGDWNTGGTCDAVRFDKDVKVQEGDPHDRLAESATRGSRVNLLNITSLSLSRGEAHVSKYGGGSGGQDCLHWCMPGIPDTWNEVLFAMLSPPVLRKHPPDPPSDW